VIHTNMGIRNGRSKPDVSISLRIGHFYFAPTKENYCRGEVEILSQTPVWTQEDRFEMTRKERDRVKVLTEAMKGYITQARAGRKGTWRASRASVATRAGLLTHLASQAIESYRFH
jgi:hypothetical protein